MTKTTPSSNRGLAGAFGAPPGSAPEKKPTKKQASKTATSQRSPRSTRRQRRDTAPPSAAIATAPAGSKGRRTTTKPRELDAPSTIGSRTRRSVRIPMTYIRRCAIVKGHLGLSQGDILMAAYTEWGAAILDEPDRYIEDWSRRRSPSDATADGRENLQPLLTTEERAALQELVDVTSPSGSWPKVVVELLERHLPSLEKHL